MEHVFKIMYMTMGIIMFIAALTMLIYVNQMLEENSRKICYNGRNAEVILVE